MRKTLMLVALPVAAIGVGAAIVVATHHTKKNSSIDADLQNAQAAGLELAQSQTANKYALSEIAPESKPEPQKTLKKNNGPKAIRSKTPTVKAEAEATPAAAEEVTSEATTTKPQPAPAPTETTAPVNPTPAPTPVPAPQDEGPILAGGSGVGRTGSTAGSGNGGGWGTVLGSILRGGVIDGDNCDPRGQPGRRPSTGTIYRRPTSGYPMGMPPMPTRGGIGGARPRR
jgi:outer membrane biosynthesis protein TonB